MPLLGESTEKIKTASGYTFSAVPPKDLGATEYTLVTIVQDVSGSVGSFKTDMEKCLKTILQACKKSPRSENLMLRLVSFDNVVDEVHGFRLLNSIKDSEYDNVLQIRGSTALYDATHTTVDAMAKYGEKMFNDAHIASINGIAFIITDGYDNASTYTPTEVKKLLKKIRKDEHLESLRTVLIGVENGGSLNAYLDEFKNDGGLDQAVCIGDVTASKLAKLADFISRSISSTSVSLGSGSGSVNLTF